MSCWVRHAVGMNDVLKRKSIRRLFGNRIEQAGQVTKENDEQDSSPQHGRAQRQGFYFFEQGRSRLAGRPRAAVGM